MTQDDTLVFVQALFAKLFDLSPELVVPDALLYEDLDLDSIDAVDLAASLQKSFDTKLEEGDFRGLKSVSDLMALIHRLQANSSS